MSNSAQGLKMVWYKVVRLCLNVRRHKKLSERYTVAFTWVPGHQSIEKNEKANKHARRGTESFIGPEPVIFMSGWWIGSLNSKTVHLNDLNIHSQPRNFVGYSKRTDIYRINDGPLPNHGYLARFKLSKISICRFCVELFESIKYIIYDCKAVTRFGPKYFNRWFPFP